MPVHYSLAHFLDTGHGVTAFCEERNCGHSQPLDLAKLIEAFGPDFIIPNEYDRLGKECWRGIHALSQHLQGFHGCGWAK